MSASEMARPGRNGGRASRYARCIGTDAAQTEPESLDCTRLAYRSARCAELP